ncbi:hypothetical protein PJM50_29635, partial [Mycobacterium kansasii]
AQLVPNLVANIPLVGPVIAGPIQLVTNAVVVPAVNLGLSLLQPVFSLIATVVSLPVSLATSVIGGGGLTDLFGEVTKGLAGLAGTDAAKSL